MFYVARFDVCVCVPRASRLQIAMIKGKLDDQLPKWMKDIRNLLPLVEKVCLCVCVCVYQSV